MLNVRSQPQESGYGIMIIVPPAPPPVEGHPTPVIASFLQHCNRAPETSVQVSVWIPIAPHDDVGTTPETFELTTR